MEAADRQAALAASAPGTTRRGRTDALWRVERAGFLMLNSTAEVVAGLGLSLSEHTTLTYLVAQDVPDGGLTQTQLAERTRSSPSAMTTRIDRLEARGLLERIPDPRDRRATRVRLTPAGEDLTWRALDAVDEAQRPLLRGLTAEDQRVLNDILRRLIVRLDERR